MEREYDEGNVMKTERTRRQRLAALAMSTTYAQEVIAGAVSRDAMLPAATTRRSRRISKWRTRARRYATRKAEANIFA
jgi:hypothetical protein